MTSNEVQAAKEQIEAQRAALEKDKAQANQNLDEAAAEVQDRQSRFSEWLSRYQTIVQRARQLEDDISAKENSLVEHILSMRGNFDTAPLKQLDTMISERQRLARLGECLAKTWLVKAQTEKERAEVLFIEAQALQVEKLLAVREFEQQILIAPLIAHDGQVELKDVGVNAELRRRAANLRLQATEMKKRIEEGSK